MPTSVPNFNFLARLVSEISRGPKIKIGGVNLPRRPLADTFYMEPYCLPMPTSIPNFNFLGPVVSSYKLFSYPIHHIKLEWH